MNLSPSQRIVHALDRLAFGPRPGDVGRVSAIGVEAFVRQQLDADRPEPADVQDQLAQLPTFGMTPGRLFFDYGPLPPTPGKRPDPEVLKQRRLRARRIVEDAVAARWLRALESPDQLLEVMADFWFNHFNVFVGKGLCELWIGAFEEEAIRPNALGNFRALLGATALHPAMLFYLDNWQNTGPDSPAGKRRHVGLNENYGRELMELHTLGVDGGYTQADVVSMSKILTGWTFERRWNPHPSFAVVFDERRHEPGDKVLLGRKIRGTGADELDQALDLLCASPATARHISFQLAQAFVSDTPPPSLVGKMARRFLDTQGDIRDVLGLLFDSPEFWSPAAFGAKFKTPYQYLLSASRAVGLEGDRHRQFYGALQALGEPLYGCLTPDGYKNTAAAWLSPDGLARRIGFAIALGTGRLPGGRFAAPDAVELSQTLAGRLSSATWDALYSEPGWLQSAMILGSPDFMHR